MKMRMSYLSDKITKKADTIWQLIQFLWMNCVYIRYQDHWDMIGLRLAEWYIGIVRSTMWDARMNGQEESVRIIAKEIYTNDLDKKF